MKSAMALLLVAALALPSAAADFAIDKGAWVLGGTVGFEIHGGDLYEVPSDTLQNGDTEKLTIIGFDPMVGYFLMPGLAAGAQVIFRSESQGDFKDTAYGIGPTVAYYLGGPYATMYPFASARFNYVKHKEEYPSYAGETVENEWTGTSLGLSVGAIKMLCRNVGIRLSLFYAMDWENVEEPEGYPADAPDLDQDGSRMGLRIGLESFIW